MIIYEQEYRNFLEGKGVGNNDRVASSVDSYVSYLRSVSEIIGKNISPETLSSESDIAIIEATIKDERAPRTIGNYKSAMRQYVSFVQTSGLTNR